MEGDPVAAEDEQGEKEQDDGSADEAQFLADNGIGCAVYYPLSLHLQNCFKELGGKIGDQPVSERISGEIMALPIYPESTDEMREYVVEKIAEFCKK